MNSTENGFRNSSFLIPIAFLVLTYFSNSEMIKIISISMFFYFSLKSHLIIFPFSSIIGDESYSIYLTHRLTIGASSLIVNKINHGVEYNNKLPLVALYFVMSICAGIIFYSLIKKEAITFLKKRLLT